ncbi:thiol peroxidase [Desulforegula conservatrix]|uniref:thiol peroxidase n=1 Tax=Desulforegula conservatrix TaxID=153026 RepID=UPI0003F68624|nr:thiol peroxidase [Desulforegula conservatrix]
MAKTALQGNTINTCGEIPSNGSFAPDFTLVKTDLTEIKLSDLKGKKVILNIFPSIDTPVCATSVRKFNEAASKLDNTVILCVSKDLPFAHARFCGAEGIEKVHSVSDFRTGQFGEKYGVTIIDSPLSGLLARSVIVVNEKGNVIYSELVNETTSEPNYEDALKAVS